MEKEKPPFWVYIVRFLIVAIILFLIVAFVHDLFTGQLTGQLPGSGEPCTQYQTDEAKEFCADNL